MGHVEIKKNNARRLLFNNGDNLPAVTTGDDIAHASQL